jgi:ribosomal protein S18 acetylase RimI-like enzyme
MSTLTLRSAVPDDVPILFALIQALAEYEQLSDAVTGSEAALREHLFGKHPCIEAIVVREGERVAGFALFFPNYSTLATQPGLYLEDLFVLPEFRRRGIGQAVLSHLARLAVSRGGGGLEWSVLDWNEPAIAFYRRIGAVIREEVRVCRLEGDALRHLARPEPQSCLRPARSQDIESLWHLLRQCAELGQLSQVLTGNVEALQRHLFETPRYAEAILAEREGKVVGMSVGFPNYSTFLTKPGLHVEESYILPEYRHQGLGKALLAYLARLAVTRDYGRLEWRVAADNQSAIAFYETLGASVLPDWRICQVRGEALTQLAAAAKSQ